MARKRSTDEPDGGEPSYLPAYRTFRFGTVRAHLKTHHAGCSPELRDEIANRIARRKWSPQTRLGQAVGITLQNYARHELTDYDSLLKQFRLKRDEARMVIKVEVDDLLNEWRSKSKP